MWDAEELLEASINSIRKDVDYIVVVYQKVVSIVDFFLFNFEISSPSI